MTAVADRQVAVVGIGQTAYSRASGRSEWDLAVEAVSAALADAGLDHGRVDGLVRYSYDNVDEAMLVRSLGLQLRYYGQTGYGGLGAPSLVAQAAAAITAGLADVVVVYRSLNGRTGTRYGRAERSLDDVDSADGDVVARGDRSPSGAFAGPYGLLSPGQVMALWARRYQWECGIDEGALVGALGRIAVDQRAYAQANPAAVTVGRTLDLDGYRAGRMISTPLRVHDLALETDGAAAVVLAAPGVARSASSPPVWVRGAVQDLFAFAESIAVYGELRNGPTYRAVADRLYDRAGVRPTDLVAAMLYDATSISVLLAMEAYGLAPVGRAWSVVTEQGLGPSAAVPVNTSGGHLSEAYVHGLNLLVEAVRQCRGTSTAQVPGSGPVLFSSGPGAVVLAP